MKNKMVKLEKQSDYSKFMCSKQLEKKMES